MKNTRWPLLAPPDHANALQQFLTLFRIVHVPFLYVMFARFIMKFSDVWKLPLQCPAVFNSVYACPPVIPPCYVS
jgi:hypothetical protein